EGVADEVDLAEVGNHPVGEKGRSIALELVEGGDTFASEADERANAEDDEGRIHGGCLPVAVVRPDNARLPSVCQPHRAPIAWSARSFYRLYSSRTRSVRRHARPAPAPDGRRGLDEAPSQRTGLASSRGCVCGARGERLHESRR